MSDRDELRNKLLARALVSENKDEADEYSPDNAHHFIAAKINDLVMNDTRIRSLLDHYARRHGVAFNDRDAYSDNMLRKAISYHARNEGNDIDDDT